METKSTIALEPPELWWLVERLSNSTDLADCTYKVFGICREGKKKKRNSVGSFQRNTIVTEVSQFTVCSTLSTNRKAEFQPKLLPLKVALQILGRKLKKKKKTKKASLYSQSLLLFFYRTLVVERHP